MATHVRFAAVQNAREWSSFARLVSKLPGFPRHRFQRRLVPTPSARGIRSVSAYVLDIIHGERDFGLSQLSERGKHPIHFCCLGGAGWQALQILVLVPHEFLCCCR